MLRVGAMEWFYVFVVFVALLLFVTQVVIPGLTGTRFFPAFRKEATTRETTENGQNS